MMTTLPFRELMNFVLTCLLALATLIVATPLPAAHAEGANTSSGKTRSARVGLALPYLLNPGFSDTKKNGVGLATVYEFDLNPRFTLGINLSYRHHGGSQALNQLGYGLLLKHYLSANESPEYAFRPFVEYGLLLNVSRLKDVSGSGTAHDTRLTVGSDAKLFGLPLYASLSYHYSRLQYFATESTNLDYLEPEIGWRFEW